MRDEFEHLVVSDFIDEYLTGRTPNPCVRCNTFIKWETLRNKASAFGCGLIATGHYARIMRFGDGTHALMKGVDASKDQSYFLWGLGTDKLSRTLFPLGAMTKDETRREAAKRGLVSARRRESQEICFIPDNDHGRFLRERFADNPPLQLQSGDVLTMDGAVAGQHSGSACYTIGQRKGLGVALGHPVYVTAVDTKANSITVGGDSDLLSGAMTVGGIVWSRGRPPSDSFACTVRIRYRHAGVTALVATKDEREASVVFGESQRAVTPGQSAVFYDGDMVLGGGIILSAE
jgi:tRNA-specific 2-thiouridylase